MKALEWSSLNYLGEEMYKQWQDTLEDEAVRREKRNERRASRKKRKDAKLLELQRELQQMSRRNVNNVGGEVDELCDTENGGNFNIIRQHQKVSSSSVDAYCSGEGAFVIDCYNKEPLLQEPKVKDAEEEECELYTGMTSNISPTLTTIKTSSPITHRRKSSGLGLFKKLKKSGNSVLSPSSRRHSKNSSNNFDTISAFGISRSLSSPNIIKQQGRKGT